MGTSNKYVHAREALTKLGAALLELDQEKGVLRVPLPQSVFGRFEQTIQDISRAINAHEVADINRRARGI